MSARRLTQRQDALRNGTQADADELPEDAAEEHTTRFVESPGELANAACADVVEGGDRAVTTAKGV